MNTENLLRPGDVLTGPQGPMVVLEVFPALRKAYLVSSETETDSRTMMLLDDIASGIAEGRWTLDRHGVRMKRIAEPSGQAHEEAKLRRAIVKTVNRLQLVEGLSVRDATERLRSGTVRSTLFAPHQVPSARTVYRYCRAHQQGGDLVPNHHLKGNHRARYSDDLLHLVKSLADEHFAKSKSRFSIPALTSLVNAHLSRHDALR